MASIIVVKMYSKLFVAFCRLSFLVLWFHLEDYFNFYWLQVDMVSVGHLLTYDAPFICIFFPTR